jgi:hypothetical protein
MEMVEEETWENKCCRCEGEPKENLHPGKRACHITCGPCLYPEDWGKCVSCEIVSHCALALEYLKNMKPNGLKKGCFFEQQLNGEENLYQALNFVNGEQHVAQGRGERAYLTSLKKANARSPCLQK